MEDVMSRCEEEDLMSGICDVNDDDDDDDNDEDG